MLCALIVMLVVTLFACIRLRLRNVPLERDEGEYAYAGQLMLQGIPPYKAAYNMKLPGTYAAYAISLFLFGQTPAGVHLGLLVVNGATTILVFFLAKQLFGEIAGVTAAAAYAVLSAGAGILGLPAHATHFVVLPAVAGLLVLRATKSLAALFSAGTLLGIAFVMKQPGIFFVIFAALYILHNDWRLKLPMSARIRRVAIFLLGAVLPFAVTCGVMLWCGVFPRFWFWIFDYARAYATFRTFQAGLDAFEATAPLVVGPAIWIWLLAAVGMVAFAWDRTIREHFPFCFGLLVFSFVAVCPGLFFRPHYFIVMLPIIAILAGVAVSSATQALWRHRGGVLVFLPAAVFLVAFGCGAGRHLLYHGSCVCVPVLISYSALSRSDHGERLHKEEQ